MKKVLISVVSLSLIATIAFGQQVTTERVSVSSAGVQGNSGNYSYGLNNRHTMSANGRFVVFSSYATNLVPGDTNEKSDYFVRDRQTGTLARISVSPSGQQGNGFVGVGAPAITADGRFIAFVSGSDNLLPGGSIGILIADRTSGALYRAVNNGMNPALSADGRYLAYTSYSPTIVANDTNATYDVFLHDRLLGITTRESVTSSGQQASFSQFNQNGSGFQGVCISADGRYIAFTSDAINLDPADTNSFEDVFIRDRVLHTTKRISVSTLGVQADGRSGNYGLAISGDGRFVAFDSSASNLVPSDGNGPYVHDVFVHNLATGETTLASVSTSGVQANFHSMYDISISYDGRFVSFASEANNLVPFDTNNVRDVFVRDMALGQTTRVSVSSTGMQGDSDSGWTDNSGWSNSMSADGSFLAFSSLAGSLVPGDTNNCWDTFVHQYGPTKPAYTVSGRLTFLDLNPLASLPSPCTIDFEDAPGSLAVSVPATLDSAGNFSITGPRFAGPYYISVKHSHWLRRCIGPIDISSDVSGLVLSLINGDVDEDNVVSIHDYIRLSDAFDTDSSSPDWLANADLDGDGVVSIFDYIILSDNFDTQGD